MCGCPYICKCEPLFTQIEVCLTSIWDSLVRVFPPLFVLAGLCDQQHFCIPKMGFGVEETFQRFFLTLTPMFFLHIKLLGGPPDCFFLTTLRKNVVLEIIMQKCLAWSFPTPSELIIVTLEASHSFWEIRVLCLSLFCSPLKGVITCVAS